MIAVLVSLLSPAALAADLSPLRLKLSAPLWQWEAQTFELEGDDLERSGSQLGLLRAVYRTEATWQLSEAWEVGAVLGYASAGGEVDGEEDARDARLELLLTGAWNRAVSDKLVFFVQSLAGVDNLTIDRGEDWETNQRTWLFGADLGLRRSLGGRLHLDGALEGLVGTGREATDDDEVDLSRRVVGLRMGLGIDL